MKKTSEKVYVVVTIVLIIIEIFLTSVKGVEFVHIVSEVKKTNDGKIEKLARTKENKIQVTGWHVIQKADEATEHYLLIVDGKTNKELGRKRVKTMLRPEFEQKYPDLKKIDNVGFKVTMDIPKGSYGKKVKFVSMYTSDTKGENVIKELTFKKTMKIPEKEDLDAVKNLKMGGTIDFLTNSKGIERGVQFAPKSDDFYLFKLNVSDNVSDNGEKLALYITNYDKGKEDGKSLKPVKVIEKNENTAYFVFELEGNTKYFIRSGMTNKDATHELRFKERTSGNMSGNVYSKEVVFERVTKYMFIGLDDKTPQKITHKLKLPDKFPKELSKVSYSGYDKKIIGVKDTGEVIAKQRGRTKVEVADPFGVSKSTVEVIVIPSNLNINTEDLLRMMEEGGTNYDQIEKYIDDLEQQKEKEEDDKKEKEQKKAEEEKGKDEKEQNKDSGTSAGKEDEKKKEDELREAYEKIKKGETTYYTEIEVDKD